MTLIELLFFLGIFWVSWLGAKFLGAMLGVSPWWFFPFFVAGCFCIWYLIGKRLDRPS